MKAHRISKGEYPKDNQYVLARLSGKPWGDRDDPKGHRFFSVVKFERGITKAERLEMPDCDRKNTYRSEDEAFNNQKGYCWSEFGPDRHFGQDVDVWYDLGDLEQVEPPKEQLYNVVRDVAPKGMAKNRMYKRNIATNVTLDCATEIIKCESQREISGEGMDYFTYSEKSE